VDAASFPPEYRPFSLAHAAGLEVLGAQADSPARPLDWVSLAPAGDFDREGGRTGRYAIRPHGDPAALISYPDFAIALLDEIERDGGTEIEGAGEAATMRHHRIQVAVARDPLAAG
jgi:hypothetical protein